MALQRTACLALPVILIVAVVVGSVPRTAKAADASQLQLAITPTVCVVDVVQDGSSQQIQAARDCTVSLPELITPLTQESMPVPLFLPFAGQPVMNSRPGDQAAIQSSPQVFRADWTPVAGSAEHGQVVQENMRMVSSLTAGLFTIVLVTGIGLDMALFELRYSKAVSRWLRHFWRRG